MDVRYYAVLFVDRGAEAHVEYSPLFDSLADVDQWIGHARKWIIRSVGQDGRTLSTEYGPAMPH